MGSWFEDDRLLDHYLSRIGEESGEPPELEGYAEMRPVSTGGREWSMRPVVLLMGNRLRSRCFRERVPLGARVNCG